MRTVVQIRDVYTALEEEVKKHGVELGETKSKHDKLEEAIQRFEAIQQRPPLSAGEKSDEEEHRARQVKQAFLKAMRHGYPSLKPEEKSMVQLTNAADAPPIPGFQGEQKAYPANPLVSAEDTAGGLFAPPEFVAQIIKGYIAFSPIRNLANVRTTANKSVQQPKRTGTITAQWVGEKVERSVLTGYSLGRIEIPTNEMYALVLISDQDLEDVNFDIETELRNEFSEQFGVAEGRAFVNGSSALTPQGIVTHPDILVTQSAATGVIDTDSLMDCLYSLPDYYAANATWGFKRSTVAALRKLRYAAGTYEYIWQPAYMDKAPNTILGVPYVELPDLPAVASGANVGILGDFKRGYTIVDRVGMSFKRLAERWVEDSLIGIYARQRVGAQVVLPEALRIYQVK
jgi:HK97 family phage major capsid protein